MSYTRVICIVLLWSCINKEAILCFTIITYIWTASCDQLIHLNANVRVNPYYGMHWAYTASVHLISLTQKGHFFPINSYRGKNMNPLSNKITRCSKGFWTCIFKGVRVLSYIDKIWPLFSSQHTSRNALWLLAGIIWTSICEGAPNRERRSMKQGDRKVYCKKVDPSLFQPT